MLDGLAVARIHEFGLFDAFFLEVLGTLYSYFLLSSRQALHTSNDLNMTHTINKESDRDARIHLGLNRRQMDTLRYHFSSVHRRKYLCPLRHKYLERNCPFYIDNGIRGCVFDHDPTK
jgi:hypothetical protein